jgi:hypothetical protein
LPPRAIRVAEPAERRSPNAAKPVVTGAARQRHGDAGVVVSGDGS